jgi:hypothetical protein
MKTYLVVAYGFIFSFMLVVGYWLGQLPVHHLFSTSQGDNPSYPLPGTANVEQINLLLVNVKKIDDTHPELQTIWLVAINPDSPIKLIPIYPSNTQDKADDFTIASDFYLKRHGKNFNLQPSTIQLLLGQELEWDITIILDNRALASFIDTFGSIQVNGENLDRDQLAAFQYPLLEKSQSGAAFHTLMWREICWNILHSPENISKLDKNFLKHASISLSEDITNLDWVSMLKNVKIPSCEFPLYFQSP